MWVGVGRVWVLRTHTHTHTCTTLSPGFFLGLAWDIFPLKSLLPPPPLKRPKKYPSQLMPPPSQLCHVMILSPLKQFSDTVHSHSHTHTHTCVSSHTHTPHTHTHTHAQTYHTHMHHTHITHTHTYTHIHTNTYTPAMSTAVDYPQMTHRYTN